MDKLGIIAGAGELPVQLAQAAIDQGRFPVVIQITETPAEEIKEVTPEFHSLGVGQIQKIVRALIDSDVRETVIIGKIRKEILLQPFRIDSTAVRILATNRGKGTSAIIADVIKYLESRGLCVIEQQLFLPHLLPKAGVLTKIRPTKAQWRDLKYGIALARKIADLDIGQTVVVKNCIPLAIEAIEGTDEAIKRGGKLGKQGTVVAKAAGTHHDFRVDVPTVGERTLSVLHESHGSVLVVEANRTFILNQEALFRQADRWNISIVAME